MMRLKTSLLALSLLCLSAVVSSRAEAQTIIKQNNPQSRVVSLLMVDSTTGLGKTGLTGAAVGTAVTPTAGVAGSLTLQYSRNGGAYTNCAGTVTEIGKGLYAYVPTTGEANTTFDTIFVASASGAYDAFSSVAFNTYKVDDLGTTLGTPVGASVSADITSVLTQATQANAGAAANGTAIGAIPNAAANAAAVWAAATRTLSAFAFTPNVVNVTGTLPTAPAGYGFTGLTNTDADTIIARLFANARWQKLEAVEVGAYSKSGNVFTFTRQDGQTYTQTLDSSTAPTTRTPGS